MYKCTVWELEKRILIFLLMLVDEEDEKEEDDDDDDEADSDEDDDDDDDNDANIDDDIKGKLKAALGEHVDSDQVQRILFFMVASFLTDYIIKLDFLDIECFI